VGASLFVFSSVEQVAIAKILRDFPVAVQTLEAGVRPIVDRLARECQGILVSKDEADYVLAGLADRIVGRTLTETGKGEDAQAFQALAIDLLTRHLLAGMRDEFHRRVVAPRSVFTAHRNFETSP
jgi:hypothetical protein